MFRFFLLFGLETQLGFVDGGQFLGLAARPLQFGAQLLAVAAAAQRQRHIVVRRHFVVQITQQLFFVHYQEKSDTINSISFIRENKAFQSDAVGGWVGGASFFPVIDFYELRSCRRPFR